MAYIDSLTDILATMVCQYLRAESQKSEIDSFQGQAEKQSTKKDSAEKEEECISMAQELAC